MKNRRSLARLLCVLGAVTLLMAGCSSEAAADGAEKNEVNTVPAESTASPEEASSSAAALKSFSAGTLDGGTFTQDGFAGKDVTVINFWATFCGPCLNEMPDLASFAKALPENVQLVTVCLDGAGAEDTVSNILTDAGYDGVTMLTADGDLLSLCNQVQYIPTTIFVDAEGTLLGDAIVGGQADLAESFLGGVNAALAAQGKEAVSLAQ